METLPNGFTMEISSGSFPLSTDSMLLAGFARLPKNAEVLDLGSGCGTLGLLLCAADSACRVTGLEITEQAHRAALENICRNQLQNRLFSICGDFRKIPVAQGKFHVCISNPPYFSGGEASSSLPLARRNDTCSTKELFSAAAGALKYGGDFYIVQKPDRLAELCACASECHLEPKRLCLVRHSPGKPVNLILLSCRKGAKPGLVWDEWTLFDESGVPSPIYKKIYHL